MLETLQNHLRSYGLNDLEFLIVNSKLSHSQEMLYELKNRVSFEVFQETDEEEVWNLMEGGKDDMYIYDRCGRLTYYIPFPLSILNETPLVAKAILTTYFRSPCGDNCAVNKTMDLDDFVKNLEKGLESSNDAEKINEIYVETEQPYFKNETFNGNYTETSNETYIETLASNDLLSVIDPIHEEIDVSNSSFSSNITDYDYPEYDNISSVNNTNNTRVDKAKDYFHSIYKLFFNNERNTEEKQGVNETLVNETTNTTISDHLSNNSTHEHKKHKHHSHEHNHHHSHHTHDSKETKKSARCLEADYQVCKSWTKKRLLHAQKCCSSKKKEVEAAHPRSCDNFGKKRCKKIQSILKCCIKTVYVEPPSVLSSNETTASPAEHSVTKSEGEGQHEDSTTNLNSDIVCCKPAADGKLMECRIVNSERCKEGEYQESSPSEVK